MYPFVLTLTFLMLIATLVTVQIEHFVGRVRGETFYQDYLAMQEHARTEKAASLFQAIRGEEVKKKDPTKAKEKKPHAPSTGSRRFPSLGVDETCPPNASRLNFYPLLFQNEGENPFYEIGAELLRRLYGHTSFFQRTPCLEYRILDALRGARKGALAFRYGDELATLPMEDDLAKEALAAFLRGGFDPQGAIMEPLTDYISFELVPGKGKINLLFAHPTLVEAVLKKREGVKTLMKAKANLWKMITDQETHRLERVVGENHNRSDLSTHLKKSFEEAFPSNTEAKELFEFTLGKPGNYLMMDDPTTGMPIRRKLPSQKLR